MASVLSVTQIVTITERISKELLPRATVMVAQRELKRVLDAAPTTYTQYVDGRLGAALETVKPGGQILFKFDRVNAALDWIYEELVRVSPVGPAKDGHYRDDHWLFVGGHRIDIEPGSAPITVLRGVECVFLNARPYARKIEGGRRFARGNAGRLGRGSGRSMHARQRRPGLSVQAPNGVYEITAIAAARRFPNLSIAFAYRPTSITHPLGATKSNRYPAIVISQPL